MIALLDVADGRDAQRFLLDTFQAALQDARLARVDQRSEPSLIGAIDAGAAHVYALALRTGSGRPAGRGTSRSRPRGYKKDARTSRDGCARRRSDRPTQSHSPRAARQST